MVALALSYSLKLAQDFNELQELVLCFHMWVYPDLPFSHVQGVNLGPRGMPSKEITMQRRVHAWPLHARNDRKLGLASHSIAVLDIIGGYQNDWPPFGPWCRFVPCAAF